MRVGKVPTRISSLRAKAGGRRGAVLCQTVSTAGLGRADAARSDPCKPAIKRGKWIACHRPLPFRSMFVVSSLIVPRRCRLRRAVFDVVLRRCRLCRQRLSISSMTCHVRVTFPALGSLRLSSHPPMDVVLIYTNRILLRSRFARRRVGWEGWETPDFSGVIFASE